MGEKTGISWTNSTWNCIRGCSVVSAGCKNCYAMNVAYRFSGEGQPYEGLAILKNGHASWTGKIDWVDEHWEDPLRWTKPRKIFVNSMSDLFHEDVPDRWIDDVFAVMQHAQARGHIFQILTKRTKRMLEYMLNPDLYLRLMDRVNYVRGRWPKIPVTAFSDPKTFPLKNVWLGTSVENAKETHRIDTLRQVPANVRFLSLEPLLGDLGKLDLTGISWAIVGGESGHNARPMNPEWARSLRDQCKAANVRFFFKQWGEWWPNEQGNYTCPETLRQRAYDKPGEDFSHVGKKAAGDLLDGVEYHEYPETK